MRTKTREMQKLERIAKIFDFHKDTLKHWKNGNTHKIGRMIMFEFLFSISEKELQELERRHNEYM